ncbi:glycosyltransferase [candidate division KSB1 bacterium]|nr:glycosyltransferase [candidate division KSB1 bacterium]
MKIKIIHVQSRICIGGPAVHTDILLAHMPHKKYTSLLIGGKVDSSESSKFEQFVEKGIDIRVLPFMKRDISILDDFMSIFHLYKIFKNENPKIVHTHTAKAGTIGRIAGKLAGVPVLIHTFHGHTFRGYFPDWKNKIFIHIEKCLTKMSSAIIAISSSQKYDLCQKYKIAPKEKVEIIPYGFELKKFQTIIKTDQLKTEFGLNKEMTLAAAIGRLVPIKNYSMALRVIHKLKKQNNPIYLVIVGDGEERNKLESLTKELEIEDHVFFYGWEQNIEKIYAGIDLMLLTSNNEGTPVTIIEAMASRVPVFATRAGGVVDMIQSGENGYLCDLDDADAMAKHIIKYLNNRNNHRIMLERAFSYSTQTFSYRRMISDMDSFYQKLIVARGNLTRKSQCVQS